MQIALHKNARTTPAIRAEIAASSDTAASLARQYGITEQTVYKWKKRHSVHDRSHTAHHHNAHACAGGRGRTPAPRPAVAAR